MSKNKLKNKKQKTNAELVIEATIQDFLKENWLKDSGLITCGIGLAKPEMLNCQEKAIILYFDSRESMELFHFKADEYKGYKIRRKIMARPIV